MDIVAPSIKINKGLVATNTYFHLRKVRWMKSLLVVVLISVTLLGCKEDTRELPHLKEDFIRAVDISAFPEIESSNPVFRNLNAQPDSFLRILKIAGVNTIRLRLWVNPVSGRSGLEEVAVFSRRLKEMGFSIWISVHYSDTWADPGQQETPGTWQNLPYTALKDSLKQYTGRVVEQLRPEYIQIGNEINSGFLHPFGNRFQEPEQFLELLTLAAQTIRTAQPNAKIIMHYAGVEGAMAFFEQTRLLDYDIIALSYYPIWHGKQLQNLQNTLSALSGTFHKDVAIAETSYPFTLSWNDWTHNIVGLESQLIMPDYPPTPEGQRDFLHAIRHLVASTNRGIGFCYWGAEWTAWKGPQATDGSPWENQALFNFQNMALPALTAFHPK